MQRNGVVVKTDRAGLKGNRGLAKKGGGGGNYTWGKPGDELTPESKIDKRDPNYDSEQDDDGIILVSAEEQMVQQAMRSGIDVKRRASSKFGSEYDPYTSFQRQAPKVGLQEFKQRVIKITDEYLVSEDSTEFMTGIKELQSPMLHYELVRRMISLAMERKERERELISLILTEMRANGVLSIKQCGKGFERLFEMVDDIVLDVPNARKYIAQFLARAVADEVLPPAFLSDPLVEGMGGEMVEQAKVLLSIKHGLVRLERVWGPSDGSPVDVLKGEIKMMLEEFLSSSDMDEVCVCVKRLNVPHFHHEIIKRAIVISLDKKDKEKAMMSSLLAELYSREVISQQQFHLGFQRLFEALPDLELDTPGAAKIIDIFVNQALKDGCLDPNLLQESKDKVSKAAKKQADEKHSE
mmetsp:Transcript_10907/g.14210  ORF Transcript_10907/g.14210 Transcript_10907/m.14210 type:complete len:410 (+) Transcript_10907:422-1651(+)|eukprot:CAMPEP_0204822346 /NCGR_PEP_ID=MMETSP1346-20131115/536_1 /ASSEMBLY_ACC=CAM_ASM_000771 /TAXON_ID=215587 /ORGANISM="Aplanochytrium stocchinoi, Strain GSBS06" /LENGTH=409 /DNA_ID=CAMNT_0051948511 /DNA_START=374 /DNA_END=1603 /DNA_ORIENTATION=-